MARNAASHDKCWPDPHLEDADGLLLGVGQISRTFGITSVGCPAYTYGGSIPQLYDVLAEEGPIKLYDLLAVNHSIMS